jgi:N-acetylmuramoyl-L-alanine amidase
MKNVLKNVSFVVLLLKMCIVFGQERTDQNRILIDLGHGGKDTGAIGIDNLQEKDVVLTIALQILSLNGAAEKPLDIYLTRYKDTFVCLADRSKLAKSLKATVFISLHCNYSETPKARGIEVYVADAASKYSGASTWLAFLLQAALSNQLGFESRGVKFANFQVIRETRHICLSILLELGFLSHKDEGNYISDPHNSLRIALSVLQSLQKHEYYERVLFSANK